MAFSSWEKSTNTYAFCVDVWRKQKPSILFRHVLLPRLVETIRIAVKRAKQTHLPGVCSGLRLQEPRCRGPIALDAFQSHRDHVFRAAKARTRR